MCGPWIPLHSLKSPPSKDTHPWLLHEFIWTSMVDPCFCGKKTVTDCGHIFTGKLTAIMIIAPSRWSCHIRHYRPPSWLYVPAFPDYTLTIRSVSKNDEGVDLYFYHCRFWLTSLRATSCIECMTHWFREKFKHSGNSYPFWYVNQSLYPLQIG